MAILDHRAMLVILDQVGILDHKVILVILDLREKKVASVVRRLITFILMILMM